MKKIITLVLTIAMLLTAVAAIAEGKQGSPMNGTQMRGGPQMRDGNRPQPPEKPADGQAPSAGQQPSEKREDGAGKMIDFDAMVTEGIISQETRDKIKAFMDEHKPEDPPSGEQTPSDGQQPPENPTGEKPADAPAEPADGEGPDLLGDLLEAGIITQAEYDAIGDAIAGESL